MSDPILSEAFKLSPEKAIEFFKEKGYAISWDWKDTWQEAHAKAFTVAKAMKADILEDIRRGLEKSIAEGKTFDQFKKEVSPFLKAKGWWGKVPAMNVPGYDPQSGIDPETPVQLGSPRRLKTIFETNIQMAYSVGRYQQMSENTDQRPYWAMVAILDSRVRSSHKALDYTISGKAYRYDDPFWSKFYPPYDWGCRCRVRAFTETELESRGLKKSDSSGLIRTQKLAVNPENPDAGEFEVSEFLTGSRRIRNGAGFNYDKGKSAWMPNVEEYSQPVAKKFVEGLVTSPAMVRFIAGVGKTPSNKLKSITPIPVAIVDLNTQSGLGVSTSVLKANPGLVKKNLTTIPEFQSVQKILQGKKTILKKGDEVFIVSLSGDDFLTASISVKKDGLMGILSVDKSSLKDVQTLLKRSEITLDELGLSQ